MYTKLDISVKILYVTTIGRLVSIIDMILMMATTLQPVDQRANTLNQPFEIDFQNIEETASYTKPKLMEYLMISYGCFECIFLKDDPNWENNEKLKECTPANHYYMRYLCTNTNVKWNSCFYGRFNSQDRHKTSCGREGRYRVPKESKTPAG